MLKRFSLFIFLLATFFAFPSFVLAVNTPDFPACAGITGTVIASYESGTHGIVGDSGTYTGSDKVYSTGEGTNVQCFCSESGTGIQTNWWKTSSLTDEQFKQLQADGWIYVPQGSVWGLEEGSYMAKNAGYSCNGRDVCPNLDGVQTSVPDTYHYDASGKNCVQYQLGGPGSSNGGVGGGGQVLGLATTGTTTRMLTFGALGSLIFAIGMLADKKRKDAN